MRKYISLVVLFIISIFMVGCESKSEINASDYLRIHIRANSNSVIDQNIKYVVKDSVVDYISALVVNINSKEELISVLQGSMEDIEGIANNVLKDNGYDYKSNAYIDNEYFPTRTYGDYTLDADYYDALILELGSGEGNNWWCVVYPPLCFVNADVTSTNTFRYKSKLLEIINKFFG